MNPSNIKSILLIIGILPTLLASVAQIGYLSLSQTAEQAPLSRPALSPADSSSNLHSTDNSTARPYRSLIIASSLIGLGSVLVASLIAIYFSRRISPPLANNTRVKPKHPGISNAPPSSSTGTNANHESSDQHALPFPRVPTPKTTIRHSGPAQFSVLIADDNDINRLLLSNQMEGRCQKITIAKDGFEALHYLTSERFDLILLDLQMPGHSGLELIKIIRTDQCINRDAPVVAITAHAQLSHRKKIIAEGFDECLIKPILTEQLDEIIDLWQPTSSPLSSESKPGYSSQILNKTCQNRELALTIAKKLFEELPQQLTHIKTALKNQHPELALEITHKLHGSVSFCGLTDIQKPAHSLEQSLLNKEYEEANIHFSKLQDVTQEFIGSERAILAELSALNNHTGQKGYELKSVL